MTQLITVKEAAELLAVSKNTIYRMVKCGKLRRRTVGVGERSFRILKEDVDAIVHPPQASEPYVAGSLRAKLDAYRANKQ